jgi:DNA polymerase elongation subunit (family B)
MDNGMKILFLDIETSPNLAYVWGLWQQNVSINQMVNSTEVICFGARWYGQRKVHFSSVHHDGKAGMLKAIHELLDEADAVVGWNSAGFDMKHLRREFIENDMLPPSPSKDIDLMKVARQQFKFPSNKLDYVSQKLGVGKKVKHSGFDLWVNCMAGDEKAWREMKKYQLQDVNLLVDLYEKFLPWIKVNPNKSWDLEACTNCGSTNLHARGLSRTVSAAYQRYQCQDCGKWLRGSKALLTSKIRADN